MEQFHDQFLIVLLQLSAVVAAARLGGAIFRVAGQPEVVGEILAGLLLGPSVLGRLAPEWLPIVPNGEAAFAFRVLSELGLVLLMFLIGLDFEFGHLRRIGGQAFGVAVAGIVAPFILGGLLAWRIHGSLAPGVPLLPFVLFVATSLSITAIPILGRIMVDLGIQRTSLGALTITAAAIDDALGWVLLAVVASLVSGGADLTRVAVSLGGLVLVLATLLVLRSAFRSPLSHLEAANRPFGVRLHAALVVLVLVSAAATSALGVFPILGPFMLGAVLSRHRRLADAVVQSWQPIVYALFLPIFFTFTGLCTDVGALNEPWLWGTCLLVIAVAMVGKLLGCGLAARLGGCSWQDSACVAVMMNTRALMGLVAVNVGRDLGVVPDEVFSMLVIMAVATTVVTSPALKWLMRTQPASANQALTTGVG